MALPQPRSVLIGSIDAVAPVLHPQWIQQDFATCIWQAYQGEDGPPERGKDGKERSGEQIKAVRGGKLVGQQCRKVLTREKPLVDHQHPADPAYLQPTPITNRPKAWLPEHRRIGHIEP